jgi:Ion channel
MKFIFTGLDVLANGWRMLRSLYSGFVGYVILWPFLLILVAGLYFFITILIAIACGQLGKVAATMMLWLSLVSPLRHPYLEYQLAKLIFFVFGSLIWAHFLVMTFQCFSAAIRQKTTILRVAQLVAVTVLIFAAAHYYVALFSNSSSPRALNRSGETSAYHGLKNPVPPNGWGYVGDFEDRLFFVPDAEMIVDVIYFSVVTTATVGYGDIYPVTIPAKFVTIIQIGMSFVLIVVVLGWVIGHAHALAVSSKDNDER